MSQLRKYRFAYSAFVSALIAMGCFFLADISVSTLGGERIFVYGFTLAFGGEIVRVIDGSVYSLSFQVSIFALVLLMCLFLSSIAAVLSKESFVNRLVACALALGAGVLMLVLPSQTGLLGFQFAYGSFLCSGFAFLSAVFDVLGFFFHPKK